MRVLVTGGSGFVGKPLVSELEQNHEVYSADVAPDVGNATKSIELDITDSYQVDKVVSTIKPEVIFHLAAKVSFRWSLEEPRKDLLLHALGTINVLEAARKIKPYPHIIFAGSSAIFGNPKIVPTPEDCPTNPTSPYGVSKLAGEKYCELYKDVYGLPYTILRFTNIYGPNSGKGVVAAFSKNALSGKPITIFGGDQEIQFVHIRDVIRAYKVAMDKKVTGTFNIGGPDVITLKGLAELIIKESGNSIPLEIKPPVEGDIKQTIFDISKAGEKLNWRPEVSIKEGIRDFVEFLRVREKT